MLNQTAATSHAEARPSLRGVHVLVLDDDRDDAMILGHSLKRVAGLDVTLHATPTLEEALEVAAQTRIDLVFVDYDLLVCTGLDALASLERAGVDAPAILMTGMLREGLVLEAFHAGVADYMSKSAISDSSISRAVLNALEKADLTRALRERNAELESTVEDLSRRQAEIQSFYHGLSHELKTPLTAAREFVALVLEEPEETLAPRSRDLLNTALRSCDQMVVCMNDILDSSRLDTGKFELQVTETPLDEIIQDVAQCFEAQAIRGQLELVARCDESSCRIPLDRARVYQILSNLVGNAIKFTPAGGTISIEIEDASDDALRVLVRDTGRGIEADDKARIFDRLYQSRHEDSAVAGGLGLGLHISRELVALHGGQIGVDSEPGQGSTFWFTLPKRTVAPGTADSR